jgi:hypothetical protein
MCFAPPAIWCCGLEGYVLGPQPPWRSSPIGKGPEVSTRRPRGTVPTVDSSQLLGTIPNLAVLTLSLALGLAQLSQRLLEPPHLILDRLP